MTIKKSMIATATSLPVAAIVLAAMAINFNVHKAEAASGCGKASWYALTSKTASGERMNPNKLTAAHRSLPFGSVVQVTNRRNGKSVNVRINDRGPFVGGRIIDVSKAAANHLGFRSAGVTSVCIKRLK